MKQFFLGLGLMAAIICSGLFLGNRLEKNHHPQAKDLERAAACALDEDWAQARALANRAQKNWESGRNLTAALLHHEPVNEIDFQFAELKVYADTQNKPEFCALCAHLAQQLRSLPKTHGLHWWNLL